jgi:hypothetical protein
VGFTVLMKETDLVGIAYIDLYRESIGLKRKTEPPASPYRAA